MKDYERNDNELQLRQKQFFFFKIIYDTSLEKFYDISIIALFLAC